MPQIASPKGKDIESIRARVRVSTFREFQASWIRIVKGFMCYATRSFFSYISNISTTLKPHPSIIYRTPAITTCGLYTFYPLFEVQNIFSMVSIQKRFNQDCVMMAHIRYMEKIREFFWSVVKDVLYFEWPTWNWNIEGTLAYIPF